MVRLCHCRMQDIVNSQVCTVSVVHLPHVDMLLRQVRANGLIIFVPKYGIEGPVYLTKHKKDASAAQGSFSGSHQTAAASVASTSQSSKQHPDTQQGLDQEEEFVLDEEKQMILSRDGRRSYTVFDKTAVKISVEETFGHRRHLQLSLVERSELPISEQMS